MASSATAAHSSIFWNALSYLGSKNEDILEISRKDDELVKDYSARMMDVVNQMRLHGEVLKDHKVMEKMMISVLPKAKKARNNTQEVQQANVSEEDQWMHKSERSFFINLDTNDNPRVKLGDGHYAPAKGRGTITINTKKDASKYSEWIAAMKAELEE
nr:retrovirus-related Pol polyprotein from transposon TNT 1-94 [Tanacetum cinerariifolium]